MPLLRILALSCVIACPADALAARLEIPLRVPLESLRQALNDQLRLSPATPNVVYRDGRCRYLEFEAPDLNALDGRLGVAGPGSAALGAELLGECRNAVTWRGALRFELVPHVDNAGRLRMRIADSELTDEGGRTSAIGFIWELSKRQLHPRLERFGYDLGALRGRLLELVRSVAPPQHKASMEQVLKQARWLEPRVEKHHVVAPIVIELASDWLAPPPSSPASAAPLSEAELDALEKALQPWDAFLVYTVKHFALESEHRALRERLFTLLLANRYRLTAMLSDDAPASGDPLRELFLDAWDELRAIVEEAQREGLLADPLLRHAAFIDAGDAWIALHRAAPALGMRLSAEGLRQLARTLRPGAGDPLAYAWTVDPELRRLFGVEGIPEPAPAPRSALDLFLRSAHAADEGPKPARSLDRWIPRQEDLDIYERRVEQLLQETAAKELQRDGLSPPYDDVYRALVPTTALIESCWRQYAVRSGKVSYLRSAAGSVGIMQINQHVWRGFYDIERLRWETAYNTRAGAQILMRYLKDYAVPFAQRSGQADDVPRAAYAVYNAGPRAVGRFAKARRHPREARVDDRLWTLYRGIASGGAVDLETCGVSTR